MNMIVKTNVKLNLGLSVLRKRADGFHDIETLFVPCFDFGDTLEIITGDDYSRTSASLFAKYGSLDRRFDKLSDQQTQRLAGLVTDELSDSQEASVGSTSSPTGFNESAKEGEKETTLSGNVTASEDGRLVQGISEDGKLMITIAREEGVDWNPLKDLCAKAYNILAQDFDLPPVKIFLEKKAPVGAGLGGGSADAAFTLKALNELCGLNLSEQRLSEYAAKLGSDCAFFVFNRPMIGSGRGEILEPYDIDLSEYEIKVLIPDGIAVSTSEAYKGIVPRGSMKSGCFDTSENSDHRRLIDQSMTESSEEYQDLPGKRMMSGQQESKQTGDPKSSPTTSPTRLSDLKTVLAMPISEWKDNLVNDFEATVFKAHPELAVIKQSLYDSGAVYASMSGSGSALFALYRK